MKRLIILGAVWALAVARPEQYKEKEDFQFSRSSSDDGLKSGFYGAQRGNMGGNYERAHNMDSLAQNQMSGLVRQVEGELGDGANTRAGSVYTAANSRGTFGSGHYDLGNLAGRNFQESTSYDDSHARSSLSSSSAYNAAANSLSQSSRRSGYQTAGHSGLNLQSDDLQSLDNTQGIGQYDYGRQSSSSAGYNAQSGFQQHSAYDTSNTNSHSGYGSNVHTRLISATPVRIIVRPGTRVAIPVAAQSYDIARGSSLIDQNSLNSDAEVLSNDNQRTVYTPNNAKHYESSYNYRKKWEKHDTIPSTVILPTIPTENPFPKNSELFEDGQARTASLSNQYDARRVASQRTHSGNIALYSGYNANVKTRSNYDTQHHDAASDSNSNAYTLAGYNAQSSLQGASSDSSLNGYNQANQYNAGSRYHGGAADSNSLTQAGYNTGLNGDLNSQVENLNAKPKSYQSSYSYHKSWERQGDPYVIKPASGGSYDGQSSQRLAAGSTRNQDYGTSGSHYQHSHQSGADCDENGQLRVARSANMDQYQDMQQQSQNLEDFGQQVVDLGQQTQVQWGQLEAGQQAQNTWENLEDLSQQSQNKWEEMHKTWDKFENLGQNTENNWNNQDFGQKTQDTNNEFQNVEQKTQNDLGQHIQQSSEIEQENNPRDAEQQAQHKWDFSNTRRREQETNEQSETGHFSSDSGFFHTQDNINQNQLSKNENSFQKTSELYESNNWNIDSSGHREEQTTNTDSYSHVNTFERIPPNTAPLSNLWKKLSTIEQQSTLLTGMDNENIGEGNDFSQVHTNSQNSYHVNQENISQNKSNDIQTAKESPQDVGRGDIGPEDVSDAVVDKKPNRYPFPTIVSEKAIENSNIEIEKELRNSQLSDLSVLNLNQQKPQDQINQNENSLSNTNKTNTQHNHQDFQQQEHRHLTSLPTLGQEHFNDFGQNENLQQQSSYNFGQQDYLDQQNLRNFEQQNLQNFRQNKLQDLEQHENQEEQQNIQDFNHENLQDFGQHENVEQQNTQDFGRHVNLEQQNKNHEQQNTQDLSQYENLEQQNTQDFGQHENMEQQNLQDFGQHENLEQENTQDFGQHINLAQQNMQDFGQNKNHEQQKTQDLSQYENLEQQNSQDFGQHENLEQKNLQLFGHNQNQAEQQNVQDLGKHENMQPPNLPALVKHEYLEQQNTQDFGQHENMEQQNLQDFGQHENLDQQNTQYFGQNINLAQQNLQDFGQNTNHEQQKTQDLSQNENLEQQNSQDFGQRENLEQQNLQVFGQHEQFDQQNLQDFGQHENLEQHNTQDFGQHANLEQHNLQVFGQHENFYQHNLHDFGQHENLEQHNTQDFGQHENLEQQNVQDFGQQNMKNFEQHDYLEQHNFHLGLQLSKFENLERNDTLEQKNTQDFGLSENFDQQNEHNLEQLSQVSEQNSKQEQQTTYPENNVQSNIYLPHPQVIEEPIQVQKQNNDLQSIPPLSLNTMVVSPIEPVTEKPGFWKSVGNKLSTAKSKIASWF